MICSSLIPPFLSVDCIACVCPTGVGRPPISIFVHLSFSNHFLPPHPNGQRYAVVIILYKSQSSVLIRTNYHNNININNHNKYTRIGRHRSIDQQRRSGGGGDGGCCKSDPFNLQRRPLRQPSPCGCARTTVPRQCPRAAGARRDGGGGGPRSPCCPSAGTAVCSRPGSAAVCAAPLERRDYCWGDAAAPDGTGGADGRDQRLDHLVLGEMRSRPESTVWWDTHRGEEEAKRAQRGHIIRSFLNHLVGDFCSCCCCWRGDRSSSGSSRFVFGCYG